MDLHRERNPNHHHLLLSYVVHHALECAQVPRRLELAHIPDLVARPSLLFAHMSSCSPHSHTSRTARSDEHWCISTISAPMLVVTSGSFVLFCIADAFHVPRPRPQTGHSCACRLQNDQPPLPNDPPSTKMTSCFPSPLNTTGQVLLPPSSISPAINNYRNP